MARVTVFGANKNGINSKGQTALHLAARVRNLREVKRLLSLGDEVDVRDNKNRTPLHLAASWNRGQTHYCTIQVLLEHGADVNARDNKRKSPLNYLVGRAHVNIIQLLLNFKAYVFKKAVLSAIFKKRNDILLLFRDRGIDINNLYADGMTLLHLAAQENEGNSHFDEIKLILKHGADVNAQDESGNTALHIFAWAADPKTINLLLDFKADIKIKNNADETPLFDAACGGNIEVLQLFINIGLDVNSVNNTGSTPLHEACIWTDFNKVETIKFLLKNGANVNLAIDSLGRTSPISISTIRWIESSSEINLRFLLKYIDINIVVSDDKNILDYMGDHKIVLNQFAKLQLFGIKLNPIILKSISGNSNYNDYFTKCTEELKNAKSTKLQYCWVTFFNLLVDSKRKLKNYAGNEDLIQDFKSTDCLEKFPIYGELMQKNVDKGIQIRKLFDESAVILSDYLPIFNPTHLIIRDTLDCLIFKDYKKLVL